MLPPDQPRVTRVARIERHDHAPASIRARPHEVVVRFDRRDLPVVSFPDRYDVADLHVLQLWDDTVGTGKTIVINPVVSVPAGAPIADLHQPGPDLLGSRVYGDRARG